MYCFVLHGETVRYLVEQFFRYHIISLLCLFVGYCDKTIVAACCFLSFSCNRDLSCKSSFFLFLLLILK